MNGKSAIASLVGLALGKGLVLEGVTLHLKSGPDRKDIRYSTKDVELAYCDTVELELAMSRSHILSMAAERLEISQQGVEGRDE